MKNWYLKHKEGVNYAFWCIMTTLVSWTAYAVFARLFGKSASVGELSLYAITAKRVLVLPPQGEVQEWFLMLGLIQEVNERPDGSGDIVFDYVEENGWRIPRGLIGIPQVQQVKNLLASAIDAAYNASPWSV